MEQNKTMPESTLIRTRALLVCMEQLLNNDVLPEVGRNNVLELITSLQKGILAFLIQKQFRKNN